eukprot:1157799-Pelagomonas_calceolata.AAC.1
MAHSPRLNSSMPGTQIHKAQHIKLIETLRATPMFQTQQLHKLGTLYELVPNFRRPMLVIFSLTTRPRNYKCPWTPYLTLQGCLS